MTETSIAPEDDYPGPNIDIDGTRYPLPENFTFREAQWIKKMTGLRMGDMFDALEHGDSDFTLAYAAVAMERNEPLTMQQIEKIMLDKTPKKVTIDFRSAEDQKADAEATTRPPDEPAGDADESPTLPVSTSSTRETLEPSGLQD